MLIKYGYLSIVTTLLYQIFIMASKICLGLKP